MTIWFSNDTHFGHPAILRYCDRPFASVEEMDQQVIQLWNSAVSRRDEVWHLGDFGYGPADRMRSVFQRLNGRKRLVIGNHDGNAVLGLDWSEPPVHYAETKIDGTRIVLYHYGMRVWNRMLRGSLQLYGHSHGRLSGTRQSLDVGVDCWDYRPVNLEQIRERLETLPEVNPEGADENDCDDSGT
jgi:calcineurin-like phosphoesterase family protein